MNNKADNIPFVHNYCDRWCERCRFVNRCAVGSSEKLLETELKMELANSEEERNKIVFQHVADNFAEAGRLLEKMIEEAGLDFEAIQKDAKENPYKEPALTGRQALIKEFFSLALNLKGLVVENRKIIMIMRRIYCKVTLMEALKLP